MSKTPINLLRSFSFVQLKPACVALSQATLTFTAHRSNGKEVTACLEELTQVVNALARRPDSLDHKLADYVFFPISQVLKASRDLPVRAMELCLQCLAMLISKGWRENITPGLSSQLVIFLSLACDTSGKVIAVSQMTDELRTSAFACMSSLFEALGLSRGGKSSLVTAANVPSLGHAVSVILNGISDAVAFEVQDAAVKALRALLVCIEDVQVLSSFFPGIVSLLTKVVTPSTKSRRHWKILSQSLQILGRLLSALLSNKVVATFTEKDATKDLEEATKSLDASWTKATASQFKVALANIERLRSHDRSEVRESLAELNLTILSECNDALSNCCSMALETLLILSEQDSTSANTKGRLESLVQTRPALAEALASVFHDELLSLTRIMQSNDDQAKERTLKQIFSAYKMLAGTELDMRLLSQMLARGLKDSITAILQSSNDKSVQSLQDSSHVMSELPQIESGQVSVSFSTALARYKSQGTLFDCIETQLKHLKEAQKSLGIAPELVSGLRMSGGDAQVATFWLVLRDLQAVDLTVDVLDSFLFLDDNPGGQDVTVREQLYSLSLDIMADSDADWRLKTLALETIAMQAQRQKDEFRGELVDVLYPILHHLGSEVAQVRGHAITCLNIVSDACGYSDVKDLVVSNVDYLVNAVALKLNAFDVSPQGPQVLLMMVQLAGPSLLPYLEDTIESIFAALEDYHGYPTLVALLFAVLKTIAEEGVKSPQLQIAYDAETPSGGLSAWTPTTVQELLISVRKLASDSSTETNTSLPTNVPQKPWRELDSNFLQALDEKEKREAPPKEEEEEEPPEDSAPTEQEQPPPAPKTYALLLKITQLTQHYLSSSAASLRISLLSLIRTTIPALAKHENSYLPLINTLWPELTSRLFDDEPHVVAASLQIIATMAEFAGEFMRSRISSLWPELVLLYRRVEKEGRGLQKQSRSATGDMVLKHTEDGYVDVSSRAVWSSLVGLLKTVVRYVGIEAEMFEEVLMMLQPVDGLDLEVRQVLEEYNADAVWLASYRAGSCSIERKRVKSTGSWKFAAVQ